MAEKTGADLFALKQEMVRKFSLERLKELSEFEKAMGNLSDAIDVARMSVERAVFLARSGVDPECPHSRSCSLKRHEHGAECSRDCPTCLARASSIVEGL